MTKIYIIRHCQTDGNAKKIFQGYTDCDINAVGEAQISLLAKRFSEIQLDSVYSSPLIRAYKTAKSVADTQNLTVTEVLDLIELNGGVYDGMTYSDIAAMHPEFSDMWANHPEDFAPSNGETMRHSYDRIYDAVLHLAEQNSGKTIACVTHGAVLRCLLCRLLYNDISRLSDVPFGSNTAVTLLEYDENEKFKIDFMNDASHLPQELDKVKVPIGV